jgi:hypothetical protein
MDANPNFLRYLKSIRTAREALGMEIADLVFDGTRREIAHDSHEIGLTFRHNIITPYVGEVRIHMQNIGPEEDSATVCLDGFTYIAIGNDTLIPSNSALFDVLDFNRSIIKHHTEILAEKYDMDFKPQYSAVSVNNTWMKISGDSWNPEQMAAGLEALMQSQKSITFTLAPSKHTDKRYETLKSIILEKEETIKKYTLETQRLTNQKDNEIAQQLETFNYMLEQITKHP